MAAFWLVTALTEPPGPGLDPDAMSYMGAAESVAAHGTYRIPAAPWSSRDSTSVLAHFPPAFPTVIALPVRLGMTPPQSARLIEAAAAFATIVILVLLVRDAAGIAAGIAVAMALFASSAMFEVHLSVLSEPLFLACIALTLRSMARAPDRPLRAGTAAALGALTRYAGAGIVGGVALWQLIPRGEETPPLRTRVGRAAMALLPTLLLQGIWVLRTKRLSGTESIRHFALYGKLEPTLRQGGVTLAAWLLPDPGEEPLAHRPLIALAAGLVVVLLVWMGTRRAWRARRETERTMLAWRLLAACATLIVAYLGFIIVSRLLADPGIPLDQRMLAPFLLLATTMAATAIAVWWRGAAPRSARAITGAALVCWWAASVSVLSGQTSYVLTWGSDFASDQWRRSELLDWARHEGAAYPLYTNWPAAVYFHLHRPAHGLPRRGDARALAAFAGTLAARDGRALVFTVHDAEYAAPDTLRRIPGLRVVATTTDGVVLAPALAAPRRGAAPLPVSRR